ncbi:MAG: SAF domain-containing protein [Sulfobacillus sp.]|nr:SAF domain-containing protein [Sulfobacillus sp.]
MLRWPNWPWSKAGPLALVVSGAVFLGSSWLTPNRPVVEVPVVTRYVPPGSPITAADLRWVPETAMGAINPSRLQGYAREPLWPGAVVTPAMLGKIPQNWVVMTVSPSAAADTFLASPGASVQVVVWSGQQIIWQSSPLTVIGVNQSIGSGADVALLVPWQEAIALYQHEKAGLVMLVGVP